MHILIIPSEPFLPREAPLLGIFQADQALALHGKGIKVGIVAPCARSLKLLNKKPLENQGEKFPFPTYINAGWDFFPKLPYFASKRFVHHGMKLFSKYIKEHGAPDLIHAHNILYAGYLAQKIKRKYNIDYVITEHSSIYGRALMTPTADKIAEASLLNCSEFITVSPKLGALIQSRYPTHLKSYSWIPNILDLGFENKQDSLRAEKTNDFTFINVASCDDNKNQGTIIKAFAQSELFRKNAKLKIVGQGPLLRELKALAKVLNISERVSFLGHLTRNQIYDELKLSNAFVLASKHETFGVVLIEALVAGIPVVSTKCGGPECIVDDTNGLLVNNDCKKSLLKGMEYLYENACLYDPNKLRRSCIENFGKDAVVCSLLEVYSRVINS